MRIALAMLVLLAPAALARADRVHLEGGSVIEGMASEQGDRLVIEVEAGAITVPRDSVVKIEKADSPVQRVAARYAQLQPGDVQGLLALADYCRDHAMPARERELLWKVIERAPDHAQARARLGYVRSEAGWITRDEQMRAQGLVQYQGQWRKREEVLELERLKAQAELAARERDKAQLELKRQELALEQARAEAEASKAQAASAAAAAERTAGNEPVAVTVVQPYTAYAVWSPPHDPRVPACPSGYVAIGRGRCKRLAPAFPIVGAKDPFDYLRGR